MDSDEPDSVTVSSVVARSRGGVSGVFVDWRRVVFGLVLAALVGLTIWLTFFESNATPSAEPTPTPTFAVQSPSESTTQPPTTSDTPTATVLPSPTEDYTPEALPTGDDLEQVVQRIVDIRHDAYTLGAPRIVGEIYDSRCSCSTDDQRAIRKTREEGLRYVADAPRVTSVNIDTVNDQTGDDDVIVDARVEVPHADFVDDDGVVRRSIESYAVTLKMVLLRDQRADRRWIVFAMSIVERSEA